MDVMTSNRWLFMKLTFAEKYYSFLSDLCIFLYNTEKFIGWKDNRRNIDLLSKALMYNNKELSIIVLKMRLMQ